MNKLEKDLIPVPKKKKTINAAEFSRLVKRVKKSFEKQWEYLRSQEKEYRDDRFSSEFQFGY